MPFVLDASSALAWHFEDELADAAEAAAERSYSDQAIVPHHWFLEVTTAMLRGERRQRSSPEASAAFVRRLMTLELEVDVLGPEAVLDTIFPLARAHRVSVYDAAYLELAQRKGIPLATLDQALASAGLSIGIEIIGTVQR
jgi:predicted nucleic acid-binding protein